MSKPIDPTTVDQIFNAESTYNEGRNYHDLCGISETIFNNVRTYVDKKNHLKVAAGIADAVCEGDGWRKYVYALEEMEDD